MADELGLKQNETKLVPTLQDKKSHVVHYRDLQFYLQQGMKVKNVHRVLMEPYIRMNTELRKQARNEFEKNFFKLMNNSVFGKTMENVRKQVDIKIVPKSETEKIRKLIASLLFTGYIMFSDCLAGIRMRKGSVRLDKPVYAGMTILDNSKILMYYFYYNHLKR